MAGFPACVSCKGACLCPNQSRPPPFFSPLSLINILLYPKEKHIFFFKNQTYNFLINIKKNKQLALPFSNINMHHHLLFTTIITGTVTSSAIAATMPSSSLHSSTTCSSSSSSSPPSYSSLNPKPKHNSNSNCNNLCKHSPSATLDLIILVLVLFSGAFLLSSYFSYIFNSLSILLAQSAPQFPISYMLGFLLFFFFAVSSVACCGARSRKCQRSGCRGLKKAMEFDLQIQTEDSLRSGSGSGEIDKLPWKGGSEGNPDYECLRSELRKMAPPSGRAVLLFRAPCGCPIAKLEGWGPKKGKRHKRSSPNAILNGGGDHR